MPNFSVPKTVRNKFLDAFAPGPYFCFVCQNEDIIGEDGLCETCRRDILLYPSPTFLPPLDGLSVGLQYTDAAKAAVLRLKSERDYAYASFLAQYMTIPAEWHADLIVPVPLHPIRAFLRGFNQSALLASYLSGKYEIPFTSELLFKRRFTMQQKRLTQNARRRNVRNSFYAEPACKGFRIVIADDVFTTGATVYECAKTLKQAGAARVYACCAASPAR